MIRTHVIQLLQSLGFIPDTEGHPAPLGQDGGKNVVRETGLPQHSSPSAYDQVREMEGRYNSLFDQEDWPC